jgi:hypothetical protein
MTRDMKKALLIFCLLPCLLFAKDSWNSFKQKTILEQSNIPGWCTEEKALFLMDFIKNNKCKYCVEIGVFSGKSLFPIAKTLKYKKSGIVFGIDAWDTASALNGMHFGSAEYLWWSQIDFSHFNQVATELIAKNKLNSYCKLVKNTSQQALALFEDNSIDFLHIDGNHTEQSVFEDVKAYFPKVKDDGYILLNDPNWITSRQALVYLLERTELVSSFVPAANYYVFRKNEQYTENANALFK